MSYRVHKYNKTTEQKIVEGFLKGLWWLVSAPFKLIFSKKHRNTQQASVTVSLDQRFVQDKLQEIEMLIKIGKPSTYQKAVLEADKLLDHILKNFRAPGLTMGDRLKASKNRFSPEGYNVAWRAHKVRNELVHNVQYELMDFDAKQTIENYRKAINELI